MRSRLAHWLDDQPFAKRWLVYLAVEAVAVGALFAAFAAIGGFGIWPLLVVLGFLFSVVGAAKHPRSVTYPSRS